MSKQLNLKLSVSQTVHRDDHSSLFPMLMFTSGKPLSPPFSLDVDHGRWKSSATGQYQICSEHFEKFRVLDTNPRKLSLGLLFVNKSVEREGAMLYI